MTLSQSSCKNFKSSLVTSILPARTVNAWSFDDSPRTFACIIDNGMWTGSLSAKTMSASQLYLLAFMTMTGLPLAAPRRSGKSEGKKKRERPRNSRILDTTSCNSGLRWHTRSCWSGPGESNALRMAEDRRLTHPLMSFPLDHVRRRRQEESGGELVGSKRHLGLAQAARGFFRRLVA